MHHPVCCGPPVRVNLSCQRLTMAQGGLAGYADGNCGNLPSPEERRTYDSVLQLVFAPGQVSQGILILRGQGCNISQMLEMTAS
jgi:hypothetical protein